MAQGFKKFILNELFFLVLSSIFVMVGIIIFGVLFDQWYKDFGNIFLAGALIYLLLLLIRILKLISGKQKKKQEKNRNF